MSSREFYHQQGFGIAYLSPFLRILLETGPELLAVTMLNDLKLFQTPSQLIRQALQIVAETCGRVSI
jgi:hypothetical protein